MPDAPVEPDGKTNAAEEKQPPVSELELQTPPLGEPVSIAANVIAAIGSFLFLSVAPTLVLEFVPLPDEIAGVLLKFVSMTLWEDAIVALGVALLFLVIGIGFQCWRYRHGTASWWPFVLAFPVTAILLVPEALAHGGPFIGWAALGAAIALVFCGHWLAVLVAVELMD